MARRPGRARGRVWDARVCALTGSPPHFRRNYLGPGGAAVEPGKPFNARLRDLGKTTASYHNAMRRVRAADGAPAAHAPRLTDGCRP